jgi:hypothetical protein
MSETQVKVTGSFQAVDEDGNEYPVTEYSIFRKTTTTEMALSSGEGEEIKQYKLGNGKILKQQSETEFELEDGTKMRRVTA